MNVLIITPILFDPQSPFNHLLKDILQGFLDAGFGVTRILATQDKNDKRYEMGLKGIKYYPLVRKKIDKTDIIHRFLSDALTNLHMVRIAKKIKADVLFEDVSYSSILSVSFAKRAKMRVVSMFQDVWPDNAVCSDLLSKSSLVLKLFDSIQRKVYSKSDRLICISDDMKSLLVSKGVDPDRIEVIYNWGFSNDIVNIPWNDNQFVNKYNLDSSLFYGIYAGNIGRMQNVELVVETARILQDHHDIHFLIIGDGARREAIVNLINDYGLRNLDLLPFQPAELATSIYSAASLNVVPLVPDGIKTALPSKTGVILSCGTPVVFCFGEDCEFAKMFSQYSNITVINPNADALASCIIYKKNKTKKEDYCAFLSNFRKTANMKQYVSSISINK